MAGVEGLGRTVLAVALGAAMTLPLLARRRAPLAVLIAVVGAAWLQFALLGPSIGARFLDGVPGGHVLRRCPSRDPVGGGGTGVSIVPAVFAVVQFQAGGAASELVQPVMVLIAAWVAGRISARRHHRAELVEHRAAQVETAPPISPGEAAERERTRIARELHVWSPACR